MSANPDTGLWDQLQWALTAIFGLFSGAASIIMTHMFSELGKLKERQDAIIKDAQLTSGQGDESLWGALEGIRTRLDNLAAKDELLRLQVALEEDRRRAADDRANIAVMMATKNELSRQLNDQYTRLVEALGKRI